MRTITVKVTKKDIASGRRCNPFRCPVAIAVGRVLKMPVKIPGNSVRRGKLCLAWLPYNVVAWIELFDGHNAPVHPITFKLLMRL